MNTQNHYRLESGQETQMYTAIASGGIYRIVNAIAPTLPYHNMPHNVDVAARCRHYALHERLTNTDALVLESAALFHDAVYVIGRKDNEEESVKVAEKTLPALGYRTKTIDMITQLIMATKLPTAPKDIGEEIICDSDIDNLGREDFWEKAERVRQEANVDTNLWYGALLPKFLSGVKYYTKSARQERESRVAVYQELLATNNYQQYLWTMPTQ